MVRPSRHSLIKYELRHAAGSRGEDRGADGTNTLSSMRCPSRYPIPFS